MKNLDKFPIEFSSLFHKHDRVRKLSFHATMWVVFDGEFIICMELWRGANCSQYYLECTKVSWVLDIYRIGGEWLETVWSWRLDCTRAREESGKGDAWAASVLVTCSATIPWRKVSNRFLTGSTNISSIRRYLKEMASHVENTYIYVYLWGHFSS